MNPRVEKLPKFKGFPVPFFVTFKTDGVPDFKIINAENRKRCAEEKLCWVCGEKLDYWIVFIGGPLSVQHQLFTDGPMHEECANDARAICPFLLGQMDYAPDNSFQFDKHDHRVTIQDYSHLQNRDEPPEKTAIYKTRNFIIAMTQDRKAWFFWADKPISITWMNRAKP